MKLILLLTLFSVSFVAAQTNVKVNELNANSGIVLSHPNQATSLGRNKVLSDSGNTNTLKNAGFEAAVAMDGWSVRTVSGTATCTSETGPSGSDLYGNRSLLSTCTGEGVVEIYQTVNTVKAIFGASIEVLANQANGITELVTFSDGVQNNEIIRYNNASGTYLNKMEAIEFNSGTSTTTIALRITRTTGMSALLLRADSAFLGKSVSKFSSVKADSQWKSYGPITIGATTTAPTKGATRPVDDVSCRQDGEFWECDYRYHQTVAGAAGSGNYLYFLPDGVEFSSEYGFDTDLSSAWNRAAFRSKNIGFSGGITSTTSSLAWSGAAPYSSKSFRVSVWDTISTANFHSSVYNAYSNTNMAYVFTIRFKGKGLRSTYDVLTSAAKFEELKNHESFSAYVNTANVVTDDSIQWISGCTGTNTHTCTFESGAFTLTPVCHVTMLQNATDPGVSTHIKTVSPTSIVYTSKGTSGEGNRPVYITCHKTGSDLRIAFQKKISGALDAKNIVGATGGGVSAKRYIVETFHSGGGWYEINNDGWVRQGGATSTPTIVSLSIKMKDSSYSLLSSIAITADVTTHSNRNSDVSNMTTTSFRAISAYGTTASNYNVMWVAEGYGDSATVAALGATPNY